MAAPIVSGVAAILKAYYPQLNETVKTHINAICNTDLEVSVPGEEQTAPFSSLSRTGGIVNAYNSTFSTKYT